MIALALALLLLMAASSTFAQPAPVECPLPPYQLPLMAPERAFIDENGDVVVNGIETAFDLPDNLNADRVLWSDDGEALLIEASDGFRIGVFTVRDGDLVTLLDNETMLNLRDEDFRDAVTLFRPQFIPGTHTVLFHTQLLTDAEGIYFELPSDLWSLDLDTGTLTELLPYGGAGQLSISPDGQYLVIVGFDRIWTVDVAMTNPRELFSGTTWIGVGHGVIEPPIVWDYEAEVPTFRTMLFPDFDANLAQFNAPFRVFEFTLGEPTSSTLLFSGETEFLLNTALSPDGYRVVEWRWDDPANPKQIELWVTSYGDPESEAGTTPKLLHTFEVPQGNGPLIEWADEVHIRFGHFIPGGRVVSMIDLCGEIVPLGEQQN